MQRAVTIAARLYTSLAHRVFSQTSNSDGGFGGSIVSFMYLLRKPSNF